MGHYFLAIQYIDIYTSGIVTLLANNINTLIGLLFTFTFIAAAAVLFSSRLLYQEQKNPGERQKSEQNQTHV